MTKTVILRPAEPERDFGQLAAWFTLLERDPNTETGLREYYVREREWTIQGVAEELQGTLLGFYWMVRHKMEAGRIYFYLFVPPGERRQGVGGRLYAQVLKAARAVQAKRLHVSVWDDCPEGRAFAERRGFGVQLQRVALALDLDAFDDSPCEALVARLKGEGFQFTTMEALGDTEEAQRKLYVLNNTTAMDVPGSDGEPAWDSFEDFQESVCQSDWYRPGGQFVAIDTQNGAFAAMCAITRFEGNQSASTLHIGVDRPYRGRKLGQAVRMLALRYARDVLKAHSVRTTHTAENLPALAIDRKLGYIQVAGTSLMEKVFP
jgi:RimJ/RimL family protein N-acetyltransferase/N-acetylglutamate synthase-like GNAT family acetyltransferase